MSTPLPPRRRPPTFQPRFALLLLYFVAFFFAFAMVLILPELLDVLEHVPTGPEQEQAAQQVAHAVAGPRLLAAFLMATGSVAVGAYYKILPGMRGY